MISMIRKVAPGHLARAILALAAKSGKKTSQALEPDYISKDQALPRRTTITVETETLLIVRSERLTSSSSWETDDLARVSQMTTERQRPRQP
jgi:hypothetical protein